MTEQDPWYDFTPRGDGTFVKFETPGQSVVGTIVRRERGTKFDNVTPCPQLVIATDDGQEQIVSGSQVNLETQMLIHRDELVPGARVKITFTGVGTAKPGQAPPKLFEVNVKPGASTTATPAATPAAPAVSADDF
jgi:hypothetical protein